MHCVLFCEVAGAWGGMRRKSSPAADPAGAEQQKGSDCHCAMIEWIFMLEIISIQPQYTMAVHVCIPEGERLVPAGEAAQPGEAA